jgi:MFS family permease
MGASVAGYLVRFVDFTIAAWLVVQQTDSSFAVGLLVFFRVVPFLIFGPFLGTLLDRFPRIAIYRVARLGMAIASGAFALALVNGFGSLPVIYAYTSITGGFCQNSGLQSKLDRSEYIIGHCV